MAFRIPLALIAGGNTSSETFTTDTLIGNLWTFLGSPPSARDVSLVVDGCDIGDVQITLDWPAGSTFTITCINGGRVIGLGGAGGAGGGDFGATGAPGSPGSDGGAAITSNYDVSIDIDDGYLLGGGGGGGGGAYTDTGAGGDAGGGGGGGQGYSATSGGAGGASIGVPPAFQGFDGGRAGPGIGGDAGGGTLDAGGGGSGGIWGAGGLAGRSSDLLSSSGVSFFYYGGHGGRGGKAFAVNSGAAISFDGSKSEATLRSEGRIKGETGAFTIFLPTFLVTDVSVAGSSTHGWLFERDGNIETINSSAGNTPFSIYWATAGAPADFGDDYEIRTRNLSGDNEGTWDTAPTAGTWTALSSNRTWSITSSASIEFAASLIEIRRSDIPAGSDDSETIDCVYIKARDENGA